MYLSIYLFIYLSIHPSIYLYVSFDKVHNPLRLPRKVTSKPPKKNRTWCFLCIFTSKCASPPQRRALFRRRNIQKWSEPLVFLTFWLRNVLRATTACTFSTLQHPKVVRTPSIFNILTSKCVPRATTACTFSTSQLPKMVRCWCVLHIRNGMQFFTSHLVSWLRNRRFNEPIFRPSWDPNYWKNLVLRDFPVLSPICIFFLLFFSSTLLSSNLPLLSASSLLCFYLSILSEIWLLNFLRPNKISQGMSEKISNKIGAIMSDKIPRYLIIYIPKNLLYKISDKIYKKIYQKICQIKYQKYIKIYIKNISCKISKIYQIKYQKIYQIKYQKHIPNKILKNILNKI